MRISLSGRAGGLVAAFCLLATAACSAGESSASPSVSTTSAPAEVGTYLALGDSVPFGFRGSAVSEFSDASNFVGYPELVGEELGLDVVNAACPGETTASFLDLTAPSNGCDNSPQSGFGYRSAYPLHVRYDAVDQSQMDFATNTLLENEDVELVTVQLGANDGFLCQRTTASRCTAPEDVADVARSVEANLGTILKGLRTDYDGQIVVVTYYALTYGDAVGAATLELDRAIARVAEANGASVADGFAAFQEPATAAGGSSTAAGLVLPNDVHPTDEGQRLLADAVLAVVED